MVCKSIKVSHLGEAIPYSELMAGQQRCLWRLISLRRLHTSPVN